MSLYYTIFFVDIDEDTVEVDAPTLHDHEKFSIECMTELGTPLIPVAKLVWRKQLASLMELSGKAVEQLGKSKSILADYQKRIKKQDAKQYEDLLKRCKEASDQLTGLNDLFLGKEDKRQGIVRNPEPTVMARIYGAIRYVNSRPAGITSTEKILIKHAKNQTAESLEKVNTFYQETWKGLQEEIEAISLSEFETIQTFEIKE